MNNINKTDPNIRILANAITVAVRKLTHNPGRWREPDDAMLRWSRQLLKQCEPKG